MWWCQNTDEPRHPSCFFHWCLAPCTMTTWREFSRSSDTRWLSINSTEIRGACKEQVLAVGDGVASIIFSFLFFHNAAALLLAMQCGMWKGSERAIALYCVIYFSLCACDTKTIYLKQERSNTYLHNKSQAQAIENHLLGVFLAKDKHASKDHQNDVDGNF